MTSNLDRWQPCRTRMADNGDMTLTNVSVVEGDAGDLYSLFDWLQRTDELRGRITTLSRQPGSHEMGGAMEILSVALGSGGAGAILASSLATWLQTRRARISVELVGSESGQTVRKLEVDASSATVVEKLYSLLAPDQKLP
jgi:membrane-associated two-gene conflict system component 1 (EACC1)